MTDLSKLCRKYGLKFSVYSNTAEWENGDFGLVFVCEFCRPTPNRKGYYKAFLNDDSLIHYMVDDEDDVEFAYFFDFRISSFDLFVKAVASRFPESTLVTSDDDWDY